MTWETDEKTITSGHRMPQEFQPDTLKTATVNQQEGIEAIVGKPVGKTTMEIQSYIFLKDKGWTMEKAQEWFNQHGNTAKEHLCAVLPFAIAEKILDKPLKIRGLALTAGISRNFNIYTPQELQAFAAKLQDAPVYMEHDHLINQFYLGCETPLPRLFSTPGFTEASANAALELQNMIIQPIQRYIKRHVERELFNPTLTQAGLNPQKAQARLNWSPYKTQQPSITDLLKAAEQGLIRQDEFRKNATKFGWQLWEN